MDKLRVFEAFAGIGSQRMALRNLNIPHEVVAISETDKFAIKSYMAIHGETLNLGDISKIKIEDIPEHDLFTYSFPCQDISTAGKQASLKEGSETRSSLLWECKKIIENKKPKYLLMENVKNLISKKHKPYFDKWLEYLENLGYTNYWKVLNAKDFGVPHNRERIFVVSILDNKEQYVFPEAKELDITLEDIFEEQVEEKYFLSDKANAKIARHGNKIVNNDNPKISCCIHAGYSNMGGRDQQYVKTPYIFPKCSTSDTMQGENTQSKILIEKENAPLRIRKLTPLECWRLMGFTDEDFYKAKNVGISNTQLYKQAGNSIVVNVLEGIFKNLFL